MVAIDKHASLLLCLAWIGISVDLVGSRVLPMQRYRWMSRCFDVTTQTELLQEFKGSETEHLFKSKAKTYQSPRGATMRWIGTSSTR